MIDPKYTKEVSSVIAVQKETSTSMTLTGRSLSFTKCNRTSTATNLGNLFVSFNLPTVSSKLATGSTISLLYPELQQLNTDEIIVIKIPASGYSEYIDGRSVELNLPINTSAGTVYYKLFSSTFTSDLSLQHGESSPLLGDNVAYLFSDNINRPYSGLTVNEIGQLISHSAATTWNPTGSYLDRPSAVSYLEVQSNVNAINSDRRLKRNYGTSVSAAHPGSFGIYADFPDTIFAGGSLSFPVRPGHGFKVGDTITIDKYDGSVNPPHDGITTITSINYNYAPPGYLDAGFSNQIVTAKSFYAPSSWEGGGLFKGNGAFYNYDAPVGFVLLDKGMVVLTHRAIVDHLEWSAGTTPNGVAYAELGNDDDKKDIYFNNSTTYMNYVDLDTIFRISTVCMALNGEFYISNNHTWDRSLGLNLFASNVPVQISEVGLYNAYGELIAMAKFSNPIEKAIDDILTFNIHFDM